MINVILPLGDEEPADRVASRPALGRDVVQMCGAWHEGSGAKLLEHSRVLAGGFYERTSGAAGQRLGSYRRRAPERTVLHELVAGHAQTLIAELREADPERVGYLAMSSASSSAPALAWPAAMK
jgi:hypothetical protein